MRTFQESSLARPGRHRQDLSSDRQGFHLRLHEQHQPETDRAVEKSALARLQDGLSSRGTPLRVRQGHQEAGKAIVDRSEQIRTGLSAGIRRHRQSSPLQDGRREQVHPTGRQLGSGLHGHPHFHLQCGQGFVQQGALPQESSRQVRHGQAACLRHRHRGGGFYSQSQQQRVHQEEDHTEHG
jgi:hypothetical protein